MKILKVLLVTLCLIMVQSAVALAEPCQRVVSLAPSLTESLFVLGLGQRVVGVTKYCNYPPEVSSIEKVGGLLDPNLEVILRAKPDLVVLLEESKDLAVRLARMGIKTLTVDHKTPDGIVESLRTIGATCKVGQQAELVIGQIKSKLFELRERYKSSDPIDALVVVSEGSQNWDVQDLFVSGNDGFYSGILPIVNIKSVYNRQTVSLPGISREGLLRLDPDSIIHIVSPFEKSHTAPEKIVQRWEEKFPELRAVKQKRVYVFDQDFASIPGPRFVELAAVLGERCH